MKAVIMAGGEGTRLRPLTRSTPKPLVPVGRRRCIDYSLSSLARAGITEIIVTTSYKAGMIVDALEATDVGGISMLFSFERQPLGTAGGVRKTLPYLDDTFIVMSADVLADVDLGAMLDEHRRKASKATMALTRVDDVTQYGIVDLDGEGRIRRFQEKPRPEEAFSDLVNAGIYVLEPEVMHHVPEDTKFDFSKNLFPLLLEGGTPMFGHRLGGLWMDIGRPRDLIAANGAVVAREGGTGTVDGPGTLAGPVQVGGGVVMETGAAVEGPAMLGDGVKLEEGSQVLRSFLHKDVRVGAGAVVEDSLVLAGCSLGSHCRISGCIIDGESSVGFGAQLRDTNVGRGMTLGPRTVHEAAILDDRA